MSRIVRVGTRGSALAMTQTKWAMGELEGANPGARFEVVSIKTEGDRSAEVNAPPGIGVGVFVREIERALIAGEIDVAVHSMKDMPTGLTPGTVVAAMPPRVDARDVLVSASGAGLDDLPAGCRVATSSARRTSQLRAARPDLVSIPIRGNVDTRLRKLEDGADGMSAMILAAAGMIRLGFEGRITQLLPLERFLPSAGQGALAVQVRADDGEARTIASAIDHGETVAAVTAERALLATLGAGCKTPVGVHAFVRGAALRLVAAVYSTDGAEIVYGEEIGPRDDAVALGIRLGGCLGSQGAHRLVAAAKERACQAR